MLLLLLHNLCCCFVSCPEGLCCCSFLLHLVRIGEDFLFYLVFTFHFLDFPLYARLLALLLLCGLVLLPASHSLIQDGSLLLGNLPKHPMPLCEGEIIMCVIH